MASQSINVPSVKLSSGHKMPLVGYGLWKVTENTGDAVYNAIKAGVRCFDGACDYGNEDGSGEGVKRAIKDGLVKREDLTIISKLWHTYHDVDRVEEGCKTSLDLWGLDYFDLYYIHFPIALKYVDPKTQYPPSWSPESEPSKVSLQDTWREMEKLVEKGMAKSIGISNYNAALVLDILAYSKIKPAALQIEHHPYLTQQPLIDLCQKNDIQVVAYSSFGPMSYVEMGVEAQNAKNTPPLLEHDVISSIAKSHGKTPAQVLLRWATQRNVAVIPKSNNKERIIQNLDVCSFDLSKDELEKISGLNQGLRFNDPIKYGIPLPIF